FQDEPFETPLEVIFELRALDADGGLVLAKGDVTREEFLDRNLATEVLVHRQVGVAEPTRAEQSDDLVIPYEGRSGTKGVDHGHATLAALELGVWPSTQETGEG